MALFPRYFCHCLPFICIKKHFTPERIIPRIIVACKMFPYVGSTKFKSNTLNHLRRIDSLCWSKKKRKYNLNSQKVSYGLVIAIDKSVSLFWGRASHWQRKETFYLFRTFELSSPLLSLSVCQCKEITSITVTSFHS